MVEKNKNCSLIATLPNLANTEGVTKVLSNPYITSARFNSGSVQLESVSETVAYLKNLSITFEKDIWLDIKGRQLRIIKWADPLYDVIELNHNVDLVYPARIYFRNGENSEIVKKQKNKLLVNPLPRQALGAGQSVNILAKEVEIQGYLTDLDKEYLSMCRNFDMNLVMASFVEKEEDLAEIRKYNPDAKIISKIESQKGLDLIKDKKIGNLMAARDDLYIETNQDYSIFNNLKLIIEKDPEAICASRIFSSLERKPKGIKNVDLADYSDLTLMYQMGYRNFMLCDNICNHHFNEAADAWKEFVKC